MFVPPSSRLTLWTDRSVDWSSTTQEEKEEDDEEEALLVGGEGKEDPNSVEAVKRGILAYLEERREVREKYVCVGGRGWGGWGEGGAVCALVGGGGWRYVCVCV